MTRRALTFALICAVMVAHGAAVDAREAPRRKTVKARARRALARRPLRVARVRARQLLRRGRNRARLRRAVLPRRSRRQLRRNRRRRALQKRRLRSRVRRSLRRLSRAQRVQVRGLLRHSRVRTSLQARYAVAAYLMLRTTRRGRGMPLSIRDMRQILNSKQWTAKRIANLGRVLTLARRIAKRDKVSAKTAFNRALKRMGVYKKFHSGVCS